MATPPSSPPVSPDDLPIPETPLAPLVRPLQRFLATETASGIILIAAALVAIVWANSPWGEGYAHFWHTKVSIGFGAASFAMSLEHWVNDGLMVLFFLLVGLEIKRELILGELASVRRATLPVAAALGGMVVPALIYAALNYGKPGAAGWGIPMATDIAFAAGVLAIVGRGVPVSVKVFLLAIAIVDDLGAVLVIAIFYTSKIHMASLLVAGLFLVALVLLNLLKVHRPLPYLLLGVGLWAATLASGVHATVAGVLLAFTIPATRLLEERPFIAYARQMLDTFARDTEATPDKITHDQSHALTAIEHASQGVQAPLARVEHALLRPVAFLIVPVFALANAGVSLRSTGDASAPSLQWSDPVLWGTLLGLVVGKPLGVLAASFLAIKTNLASLPDGATARQVCAVGCLCGIGFTMSLFVANLAFPQSPDHLSAAKLGILAASLTSGLLGTAILLTSKPSPGH